MPIPIVLDTDIGTDPDDALALLLALASPEVEVLGVTTVDGDTGLRARIADRLLGLAGRADVPVIAGLGRPLGPGRGPTMLGHEGRGLLDAPGAGARAGPDAPILTSAAPEWLAETARRRPFHLVAIGPLTNVAAALRLDAGFARRLLGLTVMGGVVGEGRFAPGWDDAFAAVGRPGAWWDHNTASDLEAAMTCAAAGVRLTWVTADVTLQAPLRRAGRDRLAAAGGPLAAALARLLDIWQAEWFWRTLPPFAEPAPLPADTVALLHDPLALAALFPGPWLKLRRVELVPVVEGGLFRLGRGGGPGAARASISVGVDAPAFEAFLVGRLERFLASVNARRPAEPYA